MRLVGDELLAAGILMLRVSGSTKRRGVYEDAKGSKLISTLASVFSRSSRPDSVMVGHRGFLFYNPRGPFGFAAYSDIPTDTYRSKDPILRSIIRADNGRITKSFRA